MGQSELKRWHLMEMVEVGKITLREAGERKGVSQRQRSGWEEDGFTDFHSS